MGDSKSNDEKGPDLSAGVSLGDVPEGSSLLGHVGEDEVLIVRSGGELFAVGARCTHYRGQLAEGLVVGDTVRCPLHHSCFNLRTGEAVRAPAFDPIACWRVDQREGKVYVREKLEAAKPRTRKQAGPESIVIIGGGGAAASAADMLRREGYDGPIAMISADEEVPVDRPNLSKDYLAGTAQDDWIPIWPREHYAEQRIDLILNTRATAIDVKARQVHLADGSSRPFGALLLATGAEPVRLNIPGADNPHLHYLRTFADSRAIVAAATNVNAKRAVVIGGSFIGLEVAASLRERNVAVDVVAPDHVPLERVMGPEIGRAIQKIHESHGVTFHLGETVARIDEGKVTLKGGATLDADLIVAGIGVRPRISLAEEAGLAIDRGIAVNEFLETSVPGISAAGDIARWPDPHTGDRIRVEHWVLAERQGQTAARNILGARERFDAVPFFWSQHYDVTIRYTGHAEKWETVRIDGSIDALDCTVSFLRAGRPLAVAAIGRDRASLQAEVDLERSMWSPTLSRGA
jgi:NADPH-dependent 2,4-dienoyl-CoA reductase/sulfur reductase-like enzyme/nitrite reductase/ring-hydroxylating ferredoxin subunit